MRRTVFLAALAAGLAATPAPAQAIVYDNVTTFAGQGVLVNLTANQGTAAVSTMLADDIQTVPLSPGQPVQAFRFTVVNGGAAAASVRPLVRFFAADGPGG